MSVRPDYEKLTAAVNDARDLAQRTFDAEVTGACHNRVRCFAREEKRLTGYPKLPEGSTMRAYSYFDPHKLCASCLAYWHIEMGAQALAHLAWLEREIAAENARKARDAAEVDEEKAQ